MSKLKLIKQLKDKNSILNRLESENIVNIFIESIVSALKNGQNIEIRGFGRLYSKKLKENHKARNPATNELIYKPERVKVRFKASKKLNELINE